MSHNGQMLKDMQRIEQLLQQIEAAADPNVRRTAVELIQLLMDLHGGGIARMLEIVGQHAEVGSQIVERCGQDDLVGQLLMLYDLHPVNLEARVRSALDKVRPLVKSQGVDVELVGLKDGVLQLRFSGSPQGCPSSARSLRKTVEDAVYEAAADLVALEVLDDSTAAPAGFVPLEAIRIA